MAFKLLKLSQLAKLENNPRTISEDDFQTLCTSIQENKDYFNARPLILSDRTGELVIIAGNQRYEAAKHLKLDTVPTYLIKGLTKEKEDEIIIRDNVSNGRWDYDALANEWEPDKLEEWGVNVPSENWDDLAYIDQEQDDPSLKSNDTITVTVAASLMNKKPQIIEEIKLLLNEKFYGCEVK